LLAVSIIFIFISSQRAKSLAQKQMDFVSSVSHEFRTPLAVIYSAGENLTDGVVIEKEKVSKYGKLVKKEGRKLSGMVEQILEFAGANSGKRKYDLSPVNVSEVVKEAIRECESVILEKDFNIEQEISETLPQVYGDEKALTQAVQNLINNSLKYCNGTKWMKVTAKNGGGKVKIIVEDRGIGISAKDKRHIFEPFFRSKTVVDEQISGNGLGLSLVKQIIEAHQGQIEVESEIKKGSKFTIQLPIKG
jgi:signal transduction histidine kinase